MDQILIRDTTLCLENEYSFYKYSEGARKNLQKKFKEGNFNPERAIPFVSEKIRAYLKLANDPRRHFILYGRRSGLEQYSCSKQEREEIAKNILDGWIGEIK